MNHETKQYIKNLELAGIEFTKEQIEEIDKQVSNIKAESRKKCDNSAGKQTLLSRKGKSPSCCANFRRQK